MEPLLLGGGMVDQVNDSGASWSDIPARFEAGSPNLADVVGFAAAAEYLSTIGIQHVYAHDQSLTQSALSQLACVPGLDVLPDKGVGRTSIISFTIQDVHPHDVAQVLAEQGVAVRAGHHCCQPLMHSLGLTATTRISFGLYNSDDDVDALLHGLDEVKRLFG